MGGEDSHTSVTPTARNKCKRKEGDSEEEEDEDDDSEDQGDEDDDDEEESGGKKGKKSEICEEEVSDSMMLIVFVIVNVSRYTGPSLMTSLHQDDSVQSASMEELEKQIEKTYKVS